jgi:lysophospholipase L1-like esterase
MFKRFLSASLLLVLMAVQFVIPALAATGDGSFSDPNIKYIGRWETPTGGTYSNSYWGGSYLSVNFTGTTVKVKLAGTTSMAVQIDNGSFTRYDWVSGTVNLTPTPLANGTHTLKVIAKYGTDELKFEGLILDPGSTTQAPQSKKIIEFIGDSITAGHSAGPQGAYESISDYAWLTGESLGTDHTQIAYSGITLATGYYYSGSPVPGMEDAFFKLKPINYATSTSANYSADWDFSKYTADAVVINLGTNDAWVSPSTPSTIFQSKYTSFLANVRAKYPNAHIFVMKTFGNYFATETLNAVNARINAGDTKIHYIDTTGWLKKGDYADGAHPNIRGHQKISAKLVPILQPYL